MSSKRLTNGERLAAALREMQETGAKSVTVPSWTDKQGRPIVISDRKR